MGEEGARTAGTAGSEGSESEGSSRLGSRGSSPSEAGTEPDLRGTGSLGGGRKSVGLLAFLPE